MFDLKISNGKIVDGSGSSPVSGDIGIIGDKIAAIGNLRDSQSKSNIDACGKVVCPGFIDMHTHSDVSVIYDHHANSKIYDGVTTEVIGNCGIGVAPVNPEKKKLLIDYLGTRLIGSIPVNIELNWSSFKEYLEYVANISPALNIAPLLAHGPVRIAELGFSMEKANTEELKKMKDRVRSAMSEGALGFTSGLVYLPGAYTTEGELAELCKEIRPFGGFYATHIRNEGDCLFESVEEAINVGKAADVPVHISHLKICSQKIFGKAEELLKRLDDAEREGVEISFDVYPYDAGMTSLSALMPPWCFEGGVENLLKRLHDRETRRKIKKDIDEGIPGWQNFAQCAGNWNYVTIASVVNESNKWLEGKSIEEISQLQGKDPYDAIFDLLIMEKARIQIVIRLMQEEDIARIISHKKAMIGSDGMSLSTEGVLSFGKPHPRAFGTHARILSKYVRQMQRITLEEAVKKMTYLPARRLGVDKRGLLKENYYADIIIFDPDEVQDKGIYSDPKQYSEGISTVIVNGKMVLNNGRHIEVFPGRILERP